MVARHSTRLAVAFLTLLTLFAAVATTPAVAADALREETSLGFVGEDVAFYATMLRNREQVERFTQSNAFAKLKALPIYQLAAIQIQAQWNNLDGPVAQYREVLESDAGRAALAVVQEGVSEEIFLYANGETAKFLDLMNQINRISSEIQLSMAEEAEEAEDEDADESDDDATEKSGELSDAAQEAIAKGLKITEALNVPEFVMGFRIRDTERAIDQLSVLEPLIRDALAEAPEVSEKLERKQIGGGEFLTMTLSGEMIPWQNMLEDLEGEARDAIEKVQSHLSNKQIVIALGVRGQYFLLSISGSPDSLELTTGRKLLIDRPEMSRLRDHAEKTMTAVSYASQELLQAANQTEQQLDDMQKLVTRALKQADLDDTTRGQLAKDIQEFSEDVARFIPRYGAMMAFQFLTDEGYEGYTQNWTVPLQADGSKPLTILQHVGGRPLMLAAGRRKSVGEYDVMAKWFSRVMSYAKLPAVQAELDDDAKKVWDYFEQRLPQLCERFDAITRQSLLPAIKDGQIALVLDARMTATQWHKAMPAAEQALPLPEFSLMQGVSDAGKMRQALSDYWTLAGDTFGVLQEFVRENEDEIREESDENGERFIDYLLDFKWPDPAVQSTPPGELFQLALPAEAGIDAQIIPSLGLGKDILVGSMGGATVQRLMQSEPLNVGGALADVDRPLLRALYLNPAGMAEMLKPWVSYAADVAATESAGPILAMAEPQVIGVLEIMQCFQGYTSATTLESDSTLTHQKWSFQDAQ